MSRGSSCKLELQFATFISGSRRMPHFAEDMEQIQRRRFLWLSVAFGAVAAAACGSESSDVTPAPEAGPTPSSPTPTSAPTPTPTAAPAPAPTGAMRFTLTSTQSSSAAPFCVGYAFRAGDIPAGRSVVGSVGSLQATVKNRWPDGSVKFAVIAGRTSLSAGQSVAVTLSAGTAAGGAALALSDLKGTGVVAAIGCGGFGSVQWSGADWDAPFASWISGPQMSSWVYRKAVGSDAHLVAWLEVRLYAGGEVEVLPWVENGYLNVSGPTSKAATYTFTLGGTQRFSQAVTLPHHCRTVLLSGAGLSHWFGVADPLVTPKHDAAYLMASELVPTYMASVSPTAAAVTGLVSTFQPLQQGNFEYESDTMSSTGYCPAIGLLPQHDMLYLTSTASATYAAVVRNGYSAGRYPYHYRDETTNRALRFSAYPNLALGSGSSVTDTGSGSQRTPTATGATPPQWDMAHSPAVGFMAYLLTGRWYFMDECQLVAGCNYLNHDTSIRSNATALMRPYPGAVQTRAAAWGFRALAHALTVTADDDTVLRGEYQASVQNTIDFFHARHVANPGGSNPLGLVEGGGDTFGAAVLGDRCFMQDFFTGAWGYALAMNLPITAAAKTKMTAFFAYNAQQIIGRLGPSTGWWYINAAVYNVPLAPADQPNWDAGTGPWYANHKAAYEAWKALEPSTWLGTTEGALAGEIMPGAQSFWGNLQPAISYAVRHGVTGAAAAYSRMTSASNWASLVAQFNTIPVWSVRSAR